MSIRVIAGVLRQSDLPAGNVVALYREDFEGNFGLMNTPGLDEPEEAWTRLSSPTPTTGTGPDGGSSGANRAVTAGDSYAYTEGTPAGGGIGPRRTFSMETPAFDANGNLLTLTFDVHMFFSIADNTEAGTLTIQGWNGSAWSQISNQIVGQQQTSATAPYLESTDFGTYDSTGFSNSDFKFRFLFETGGASNPFDAAVDNILITGPEGLIPIPPDPAPPVSDRPDFGGPFAPWAIPAANLVTDPNSANEVQQIYNIVPGQFNLNTRLFCPAAFREEDANIIATVNITNQFGDLSNIQNGSGVPWNTNFRFPGDTNPADTDSTAFIYNSTTGRCHAFSVANFNPSNNTITCAIATLIKEGVDRGGPNANIFEKENGTRILRACGIAYRDDGRDGFHSAGSLELCRWLPIIGHRW